MPTYSLDFHFNDPEIADVEWKIRQALFHGDRERARILYFQYVVPDSAYSDHEVERIGYQVGAVDVGDLHVASRSDL